MGEQVCLRWNSHQPNFISVFKNLFELQELVDVTLSVEGNHIKAHKVILSACSPYFKLLFTMTPCKHPIVILNDIKYADLKTIVDFMYCGEISIPEDKLPDLLEIAEVLQVRGLFDPSNKSNSSQNNEPSTKKRRRKSGLNDIPQWDMNSHQQIEEISSIPDFVTDTDFDLAKCSNNISQSHHSILQNETYPIVSLQGSDNTPNTTEHEENDSLSLSDQTMSHILPYITKPDSTPKPIRKRNSTRKVQESENFLLALEAVRSGSLGFCKAAKVYGLNNRTLWLEYKKRGYPATRPPVAVKHKSKLLSENNKTFS